MQPGNNGTTWPGGVNDANAVFEHNGLFHVMYGRRAATQTPSALMFLVFLVH